MEKNKKYNVIIDTNVIVSALLTKNTDSATFKVMKLFFNNEIVLYYSKQIMNEYLEVLSREKFKFNSDLIESIKAAIEKFGIEITPKNRDTLMIDVKDKPFYEIVIDEQIDAAKLITGNIKHFPIQTNIMTPAQFMEIYTSNK